MKIDIPGYRELEITHILLDYNGTLATDGYIREAVKIRLCKLAEMFQVYVLTADTHGTAKAQCEGLGVRLYTFPVGNAADYKAGIVKEIGGENCACFGNGRNDMEMLKQSVLSIAVVEQEGTYGKLLAEADLCVYSIEAGLDLLLYPKRLIAGLRG